MRPACWQRLRRISPCPAYSTMLRATSEIAVAMTVRSLGEKPNLDASERPSCRAVTMSAADPMETSLSAESLGMPGGARSDGCAGGCVEVGEPLLEVERGCHVLEGEPELDHGEGYLGLDAHDDRLRAPQLDHVRDRPQRADGEGVHHVEDGDVHDGALRAVLPDLLHEVVAELEQILVGERRLDRRDQVVALLEDGNAHRSPRLVRWTGPAAELRPAARPSGACSGPPPSRARWASPRRSWRPGSRAGAPPPRCRPGGRRRH